MKNTTTKVRITWNGMGGEVGADVINVKDGDDKALTNALIKLVQGNIITPGDSFTVQEIE